VGPGDGNFPNELRPQTVTSLLDQQAERYPDHTGFVAYGDAGAYSKMTFREWRAASIRVAAALCDRLGISRGDRVAWMLPNDNASAALILYHAIARLAAVNVPINDRLTHYEVRHILEHCDARVLLVAADRLQVAREATAGTPRSIPIVLVGHGRSDDVACSFGDLTSYPADGFVPREIGHGDNLCLVYTSGTTGLPKGVLHTHGSAIVAGLQWADVFRLQNSDVLQSPFPIFSGAGLHFNGLSCLWTGATFVVERFDPVRTLSIMAHYGTTVYVAVPTVFRLVLDHDLHQHDLHRLRILDYGGASMPPAMIRELQTRFPDIGLMQTYGLTEAGPGGIYLPEEYAESELGSVGNRPMGRYTRFKVVREDGSEVGPKETGEFIITGPSLMKEYYKDPAATAAAIRDGWLWTGDMVQINERGFVYHIDRRKDLVLRGGYNVSSAEVEAVLAMHPGVAEAAVVGKPHPTLGEDTKAYVVLREGADVTAPELVRHCAEQLADWKVPRDIEFLTDLPRNAAGKVLKRVLREHAAGTS
jgi:acyl-CoA synthetase (AMP-forming)/AMP-acid ligase II